MFSGIFGFEASLAIFKVHFPGYPVVPGSMIVDRFICEIKRITRCDITSIKVKKFKLLKFIPPGNYKFSIKYEEQRYICMLYENNTIVVKGEILVREEDAKRKLSYSWR